MKHRGRRVSSLISAVLLVTAPCNSTVLVYLNDGGPRSSFMKFEDVPANYNFGPRIPKKGFSGRLQVAMPDIYACSPIAGPSSPNRRIENSTTAESPVTVYTGQEGGKQGLRASSATDRGPIAVLVSRSIKGDPAACTFQAKVVNAQAAGYRLVIVYDSEEDSSMFKMGMVSNENKHPAVDIPVVLVTHSSGLALTKLIDASTDCSGPEVSVDSADPFVGMFITVNITMFVIIMGFMVALLACGTMLVFTLHRYLRRYEELVAGSIRPMSQTEVLQLPEVQVEAGSTLEGDSCPICLEAYRAGDKLRSLPCNHAFHADCIMPWLTERQRTCPMCKDAVTVGVPTASPSQPVRPTFASLSSSSSSSSLSSLPSSLSSPPPARSTEPGLGPGRLGRVMELGGGSGDGDRLPLLSNPRGLQSSGGSIQETSLV